MRRTLGVIALVWIALEARAETWRVVPESSSVRFIGTSSLNDFIGTAAVIAGALRLDPQAAAGFVDVDAASMDTDGAKRDERMRDEVMKVRDFPRVRFDLRGVEATASGILARGAWTMHGVARELAIPVRLERGGEGMRASASFSLDIRRWDIPAPRVLVVTVDPDVRVEVDLRLVRDDALAAPRVDRGLAGATAADAAGAAVDLGPVAMGHVVVLYQAAGAGDAALWLSRLADRGIAAVAVRDGAAAGDGGPAGALVDASGEVRRRLLLPRGRVQALIFAADGQIVDEALGAPKPAVIERVARQAGQGAPAGGAMSAATSTATPTAESPADATGR